MESDTPDGRVLAHLLTGVDDHFRTGWHHVHERLVDERLSVTTVFRTGTGQTVDSQRGVVRHDQRGDAVFLDESDEILGRV